MRDQVNDENLLSQVAMADRVAFATLLARHLNPLLAFIKRYVPEHASAEDIAQELFMRVWQHAGSWQARGGTARSWLYRIAYNLCMDTLRRRKPASDEVDKLVSPHTPDQALLEQDRQQQFHRAMAALPERQRTALYLCAYQGLSNQEAAATLEVSVRALESLLTRARRSLRTQLTTVEGQNHE
jgi:RNA polymerase sigma-70 factor (ECF subfamily)